MSGLAAPARGDYALALGTTLGVQIVAALAFQAVPVMAPAAAADLGFEQRDVGYFTALVFVVAAPAAVAGGVLVRRLGALGVSQACMLTCGIAAIAFGLGSAWILLPAALLLGLGYGPTTPASSDLLARLTPPRFANLTFSVKQTGVPLGYMAAGRAIPARVARGGWPTAAVGTARRCAAAAIAIEPARRRLDRPGVSTGMVPVAAMPAMIAPVAAVWQTPNLRRLAIVSFVFAASQTCVTAFLVVCLVQQTGLDLATAGVVLAIGQVAGAIGRIAWGGVADATGRPLATLAAIGGAMSAGLVALAQIDPGWPFIALAAVSALLGATAVGWNGVFYAEIARQSPRGQAAAMTGGVVFFTYLGPLLAPALFSAVLAVGGSYGSNFTALAICDVACAIVLLRMARAPTV